MKFGMCRLAVMWFRKGVQLNVRVNKFVHCSLLGYGSDVI